MMEWLLPLILGIIGSAGIFAFLQFLITRHDQKNKMNEKLDKILAQNVKNELAITKVQLQVLFALQPKNHDTILTVAQRYFLELNGNAEMYNEFVRWANAEKVSVSWFESVRIREERKIK